MDCISCPGSSCSVPINDQLVIELIDANKKGKYEQLITNGYVQSCRLVKWCPSAGCERAIKVDVVNQPAVRCKCGSYFCFQCLEEIHDLIPCKLLKDFTEAKAAHLETASWLVENTKQCPNCHVNIEKNGGCNHISCSSCQHQFCWVCSSNWNFHFNCVAVPVSFLGTSKLRQLVDSNTKRQTMIQSVKLDEKMYKLQLHDQDLEFQEDWMKMDFVKTAVNILLRCRRTLADSFVFAYFFSNDEDTQWTLFDLNQKNLLKATEDLSHILETKVNCDNFHSMKFEINEKARYCRGLHRALFDHVQDGFENDSWQKTN